MKCMAAGRTIYTNIDLLVDSQWIKYFNLGKVYFFIDINIFRHLKLETALAKYTSKQFNKI